MYSEAGFFLNSVAIDPSAVVKLFCGPLATNLTAGGALAELAKRPIFQPLDGRRAQAQSSVVDAVLFDRHGGFPTMLCFLHPVVQLPPKIDTPLPGTRKNAACPPQPKECVMQFLMALPPGYLPDRIL